jgi:glucose-6-phosphate 1-dehydrogenase
MKTTLVIFGITGDLSTRKLLPALAQIIDTGDFDTLSVIGVSRRELDMHALLSKNLGNAILADRITGFSMDTSSLDDYKRLKDFIDLKEDEQLLLYLSVPPGASGQMVELLGQAGLNMPSSKLLLEKPFGVDLDSARHMIEHIGTYYDQSQVYRIDHYLAKEMTQNIIAFREGNAMFDHVWHNGAIERIEVLALESIGIEGRAQFYEQTGALRDVLQGHLMQLLALVLMEVPHGMDWDDASKMRLNALNQVQLADPMHVIRGQYDGYRNEVNNNDSQTETFASVTLYSDDSRWQGVPLLLATGKNMNEKSTEVRVYFRKSHESQTNCLVFNIQPHEGVEIELFTKRPGYDHELETQTLSFTYPAETKLPDAYEQVIVDAIRSRKSLFATSEEVIRSWEILTPIQNHWGATNDDLKQYHPGSSLRDLIA